uniref:G-protein coupled receptors family 1 profile domain-containing protein n=1 Tax=Plectus sambesii TaxID=2011161 RepID=A0A914W2B1_9BILA
MAERINRSVKAIRHVLLRIERLSAYRMTSFSPPTHVMSDYFEIAFLIVVFAVGCTLNVIVLVQATKQYKRSTVYLHQKNVKTGHLLFKIHLIVTNLVVLVLYCPLKIAWLVTYEWRFGDIGCRLINFAWMGAFCLVSNMVTSIAIDRAIIFRRLMKAKETGEGLLIDGAGYLRVVHWLTIGSYVLAIICSAPQLVFWRLHVFTHDEGSWAQCVSEWQLADACAQLGCTFKPSLAASTVSRTTYAVCHTLVVFWLPFSVIVLCYGIILKRLASYSCARAPPLAPPLPCEAIALSRSSTFGDTEIIHEGSGVIYETTSNTTWERHVPVWRGQMRSRIFKTAAAVVLCYLICWLPYNVVTLAAELNRDLVPALADADFLKWFILINAVTNPLLYGCPRDSA